MDNLLLISTIILSGILGGIVNAIRTGKVREEYWKSIIKGIVAAFLIPVFLEIIKSEIGSNLGAKLYDYLIFAGLCLIAAIFSDKFIDTIGDKILQKAENAERKAEESSEKLNVVIEKRAEPSSDNNVVENTIENLKSSDQPQFKGRVEKIIEALRNKNYDFRTREGIAKESGFSISMVMMTLTTLEQAGIVKRIQSDKRTLWTLNQ